MRIAEVLSDLTSLKVCDPAAALALVSARPVDDSKPADEQPKSDTEDAHLQRAKDLVDLHYAVKRKHERGTVGDELLLARGRVKMALRGLGYSTLCELHFVALVVAESDAIKTLIPMVEIPPGSQHAAAGGDDDFVAIWCLDRAIRMLCGGDLLAGLNQPPPTGGMLSRGFLPDRNVVKVASQ